MYRKIFVPLDNSKYSDYSIEMATEIAGSSNATLVGNHVYAAKLHEVRFTQMEPGLPDRFQDPAELQRQRDVHSTLITTGLELISDSYLDVFTRICEKKGLKHERSMLEGKNYQELVKDIQTKDYDLVIMGFKGIGSSKSTTIGSVTERVVRRVKTDTLIMKNDRPLRENRILVAIDGSEQSYEGLRRAMEFSKYLGTTIEAVSVYDPNFHYVMFNNISKVLSEEAGEVFRFKEQEALHENIIDEGLEKIYTDYLSVAKQYAEEQGVEIKTTLLSGKAFVKINRYVEKIKPALLVMGKIGYHADEDLDIGACTENLLRSSDTNLLLVNGKHVPKVKMNYQEELEPLEWDEEATASLNRAPQFVHKMVIKTVENYAREVGSNVVTGEIMQVVRAKFGM